ncbi:DUF4097 family beta strand repeat-containing protein [Longispora fulva]|uniref:DUF4097 and DUF4098 domain-containing protein YvlB n=1 Tax=Longispora fulva TaxID=619741 RepID=A0A8J7G7Z5_9ACTN|nr:DUF4097 family beta strand repeat-containing protein [Longispora fulva]MBG6134605.1 DUF4097 and DUF4098 domain-containing protein YvlB [Longispora fulva]
MPTFDTPEPISVTIDLGYGDVRLTASDRADTTVEVRPSNPAKDADVRSAEQTQVEFTAGRLLVKGPKQRLGLFGKIGSVDVDIALPSGSHLHADAGLAAFRAEGRLGECRIKAGAGDLHLEDTATVDLNTSAGAITLRRVAGNAEVSTGTGRVRLQHVDGTATVKNSNGDTWVGTVTGDLRVKAANGDITVDSAHADVTATTANGVIRIGETVRGTVSLKTAFGELEVGVRAGTAALLDVHTQFGHVRNSLQAVDAPAPEQGETIEIHARTSFGDIIIHHS